MNWGAALIIIVLAGSLLSAGVYVGETRCAARNAQQQVAQIVQDGKAVETLKTQEQKREVVYRDRIKVVRETVDNCLAVRMPGGVVEQLRNAGGADAARPPVDGGLPAAGIGGR